MIQDMEEQPSLHVTHATYHRKSPACCKKGRAPYSDRLDQERKGTVGAGQLPRSAWHSKLPNPTHTMLCLTQAERRVPAAQPARQAAGAPAATKSAKPGQELHHSSR